MGIWFFWSTAVSKKSIDSYRKPLSVKMEFFLVCSVIAPFICVCVFVCVYVCMSSITLRHRLSYRAENLNTACLLRYLWRFWGFFQNFVFWGPLNFFSPFLTVWDLSKNLVEHNTFILSGLQSCKLKYSFLTGVPRKVFELFLKFYFF